MSKYLIEIQFADRDGSDIDRNAGVGRIIVKARETCECRKLILLWRAEVGRDDRDPKAPLRQDTIIKWTTWEANQIYEYRFALDGQAGGMIDRAGRWFIRPEVYLTGAFEPDTPLKWTALPSPVDDSLPSQVQNSPAETESLPAARQSPPAVPIEEVPSEPPPEKRSYLKRIAFGPVPCHIFIIFEKEDRTYRPGERIRGKVNVQVLEDCECSQLVLSERWKTHGKGNQDKGGYKSLVLGKEMQWRRGTEYVYAFAFTAPDLPFSYHGHYINRDWYLKASAHLRGFKRAEFWPAPSQEIEFLLEPHGGRYQIEPLSKVTDSDKKLVLLCIVPMLFGVMAAVLLYQEGITIFKDHIWWAIVPFALGVFICLAGARNFIAQLSLGRIEIQVDSPPEQDGLEANVRLTPKKTVEVNSLEMELLIQESATKGGGSDPTTHTFEILKRSTSQQVGYSLHAGQTTEIPLHLRLPADLPPHIEEKNNRITWNVTLQIDTGSRFYWKESYPIEVTYSAT